jgi:CelD/BcsL family acetyltransferase involved in cellulose biosynthesis
MVVGRLEHAVLRPSIGYARLPGVPARVLTIIHEGVLGGLTENGADAVAEKLEEALARRDVDIVSLHMLREESTLWPALRRRRIPSVGLEPPRWAIHRELILQKEPDFLLRAMRSKHRSWVKRKERELEQAYPGKVRWERYPEVGDLSDLCSRMEFVARSTYQRGMGAGFVDDELTRQRLELFARRGQLRVLLLRLDGAPSAYWLGVVYGDTFHAFATGYVPEMVKYEVGTLAFLRMVEDLVREGVGQLDFGLGDAYYKERFANRSWREASVQVFARTAKGRLLRGYLGTAARLENCALWVVKRLGIFDRVKGAWRARLRTQER